MSLFVLDFHGVLEKGTEDAVQYISNKVLEEMGYKQRFTGNDMDRLYGLKWHEYFPHILPEETPEKHNEIQCRCLKFSISHPEIFPSYVKPTEYSHNLLQGIEDSGHAKVLISNTSEEGMQMFLRCVDMAKYFPNGSVKAIDSHTKPATKPDALREFLDGRTFDRIVIVGDSPSDMELKSVAGGTTYLYTHPGKPFRSCEADYRIRDLREVTREL